MLDRWRAAHLIGFAGAVAATAAIVRGFGPEPSFIRPMVHEITVGADTVWFCSEVYPSLAQTTFGFIRATREWRRLDVEKPPCARPGEARMEYGDTVLLGPGVVSIAIRPDTDARGIRHGESYLRVSDSASGHRIDLRPRLDSARVRRLMEEGVYLSGDTISTQIGGVAFSDSIIWIGLAGGFAEGEGALGGIHRIDRRAGVSELLVDQKLASHTITGMASVGNWLWAGTENPAEYGPYGDAGLMRMDLRTREWKSYVDSTSPIPDALIRELASDGRVIAMATERGLAVIELAGVPGATRDSSGDEAIARWSVRYFVPGFVGDSMVFDPGAKVDALLDQVAEAPFMFAQRFARPGHERAVLEGLKQASPDSIARAAYEEPEVAGRALADPMLAPAFVSMLTAGREAQVVAASAIGAMGNRAPEPAVGALRRAFLAVDTVNVDFEERALNRGALGRALLQLGDTMPVRWARSALEQIVRAPTVTGRANARELNIRAAAAILGASRDPLGLTLLVSVTPLAAQGSRADIIQAFAAYDTPQAWGAATSFARSGQLPKSELLYRLTPTAINDPVVGARIRELLLADLGGSDGSAYMRAAAVIRRLRLIDLAPAVIESLERASVNGSFMDFSYMTLVSLSGRADAPAYRGQLPPPAIAFWRVWVASAAGRLIAVSPEDGEKAVAEWSRRRPRLP